jgi:molybdopterin-guanine dinucleotide biosynthesis protein A
MRARVSGIVLAGGRSTRFGTDKLAATVAGRPLLHLAIEAVRDVTSEVIVAGGADAPDPALPPGTRFVRDGGPNQGPLAGVLAGARAAAHDHLLVVGGDMPSLSAAVLDLLCERLEVAAAPAVALAMDVDDTADAPGAASHPLPIALRRGAALAAGARLQAADDRSLRSLLRALGPVLVEAVEWRALDPEARTLRDIDTPGDLAELLAG